MELDAAVGKGGETESGRQRKTDRQGEPGPPGPKNTAGGSGKDSTRPGLPMRMTCV